MKLSEHCKLSAAECKAQVDKTRTLLYEMYNGEMDDFILKQMVIEYDNNLFYGMIHRSTNVTVSWDDDSYFVGEHKDSAAVTGCQRGKKLHIAMNGHKFEEHHVNLANLFTTLELQLVFCMQSIVRGCMVIDDELMEALKVWFDADDVEHEFW